MYRGVINHETSSCITLHQGDIKDFNLKSIKKPVSFVSHPNFKQKIPTRQKVHSLQIISVWEHLPGILSNAKSKVTDQVCAKVLIYHLKA